MIIKETEVEKEIFKLLPLFITNANNGLPISIIIKTGKKISQFVLVILLIFPSFKI